MEISILLETLSAPVFQRRAFVNEFGGMANAVTCYHVTDAANLTSILQNGLRATECQQGRTTRRAACYLFVDRTDINSDTIKILGIKNPVVVKATLTGEQLLDKAGYDGMFNATFDCAWSAIQYIDNIPASAIEAE